MTRGGYRPGSGRKKGTPASNRKYSDTSTTKVVRVPVSFDEVKAVEILTSLSVLVGAWQVQVEEAAKASITGATPRTYDHALHLLDELRMMIDP
jgi:hypothetical protein